MSLGLLLETPVGPQWVVAFDPDGGDPEIDYPTGMLDSSDDPSDAMRFDSFIEATEFWRQTSTRTPVRPDGMPNRPLTAYTVQIKEIP